MDPWSEIAGDGDDAVVVVLLLLLLVGDVLLSFGSVVMVDLLLGHDFDQNRVDLGYKHHRRQAGTEELF